MPTGIRYASTVTQERYRQGAGEDLWESLLQRELLPQSVFCMA